MKRSNSGTDAWQKTVAIFKVKEWLSYYQTLAKLQLWTWMYYGVCGYFLTVRAVNQRTTTTDDLDEGAQMGNIREWDSD